MTAEDYVTRQFLSLVKWVDYIATFDVPEGQRELQRALNQAPPEAVGWDFSTTMDNLFVYSGPCNTECVAINFYKKRNYR